ncbi:E1_dh domain-containing protein, partial [Cephalotus follicularis]
KKKKEHSIGNSFFIGGVLCTLTYQNTKQSNLLIIFRSSLLSAAQHLEPNSTIDMALSQLAGRSRSSNLLKTLTAAISLVRPISTDTTPLTIDTSLPFTSHKCDTPSRAVETDPQELLFFFRQMALMRRMEIAADSLYKAKLIRGFCHLYDGQEAVAIGMEAAITKKDSIITAYRDHCTFIGRGGTLPEMFSELMGRQAGCSRGKGGSMHFYKKDSNFYGGHGIVGAQVPLGCGLAFAQKYSKDESVSFALYGDGAANQGQLFEALNIAALWDLPAIFVCENNHYGMGTAEWRAAKSPAYYKRGDYVPGLKIDGMDVLAVKQGCKFAKEYALKNGPIILEMDTYRYHGHSMSDPGSTYRTRDEISGVRQERDPIERVRKLILSHDLATEKELKDIEKEVRKEVDEAISQAKESPMPEPSELYTNVYVKGYGVEAFGPDRKEARAVLP